MSKKLIQAVAILLLIATLLSFTGCGGKERLTYSDDYWHGGLSVSGERVDSHAVINGSEVEIVYNNATVFLSIPSEHDDRKVTAISRNAFLNHKRLRTVHIPDTVLTIYDGAFSGCERLLGVKLPRNLMFIGSQAFGFCKIKRISIPKSTYYIAPDAFCECYSLRAIKVAKDNEVYSSLDSKHLGSKDGTRFFFYAPGSRAKEYEIPNSVTTIENNAFSSATKLKNLVIPESVSVIYENAFYPFYLKLDTPWISKITFEDTEGWQLMCKVDPHLGGVLTLAATDIPSETLADPEKAAEFFQSLPPEAVMVVKDGKVPDDYSVFE